MQILITTMNVLSMAMVYIIAKFQTLPQAVQTHQEVHTAPTITVQTQLLELQAMYCPTPHQTHSTMVVTV